MSEEKTDNKDKYSVDITDYLRASMVGGGTFIVMTAGTYKFVEIMNEVYVHNQVWINNYFGKFGEIFAEYTIPGLYIAAAIKPLIRTAKIMFESELENKVRK